MKQRNLAFCLVIFSMMLGLAAPASASSVSVALTAKFEEQTHLGGGVIQYKVRTVRLTQKDVLTLLNMVYVFPVDQAILQYDLAGSEFTVVPIGGGAGFAVSSAYLNLFSTGNAVRSGLYDPNPGKKSKVKSEGNGLFVLDINDANWFELNGMIRNNASSDVSAASTTISVSMSAIGHGEIEGHDCVLSGKIKLTAQLP